ncbi:hypothetical protein CR513_07970, partial [Mucuna pruriens]
MTCIIMLPIVIETEPTRQGLFQLYVIYHFRQFQVTSHIITVNENNGKALFYWFFEAQSLHASMDVSDYLLSSCSHVHLFQVTISLSLQS